MQKINYQKMLDETIRNRNGKVPTLLLHACCAPCSSYVLEYLSQYFRITLFYYNPNISPEEEYVKRVGEVRRLLSELPVQYPVEFVEGRYDSFHFLEMAKGHEHDPERGERCRGCYRMRLEETAKYAKAGNFDWFTTTLTVSPYKNAQELNAIGEELAGKYGVRFLHSDFKKRNGSLRSIQLSRRYGLYRQNYCGCVFSKENRRPAQEKP